MIKWAADWWGIELIAETEEDADILNRFISNLEKNAIQSYSNYSNQNDFETGTQSSIMEESYPLVITFNRGD